MADDRRRRELAVEEERRLVSTCDRERTELARLTQQIELEVERRAVVPDRTEAGVAREVRLEVLVTRLVEIGGALEIEAIPRRDDPESTELDHQRHLGDERERSPGVGVESLAPVERGTEGEMQRTSDERGEARARVRQD